MSSSLRSAGLVAGSLVLSLAAWSTTRAVASDPADCETTTVDAPTDTTVENFGKALALKGETLVVTGDGSETDGGSVTFYALESGPTWTQTTLLTAPDTKSRAAFGSDVDLSGDGTTVVVGDADQARVYGWGDGGGWQQTTVLTADDRSLAVGGGFGSSVSVTDTADIALVGAPGDDKGRGTVTVYQRAADDTEPRWLQVTKLTADDTALAAGFGSDTTATGGLIAVSAPNAEDGRGQVHLYEGTGEKWVRTATLEGGDLDGQFGDRIASDGTLLAVTTTTGEPALYLYDVYSSKEIKLAKRFAAADLTGNPKSVPVDVAVSAEQVLLTTEEGDGSSQVVLSRDGGGGFVFGTTSYFEAKVGASTLSDGRVVRTTDKGGIEYFSDAATCPLDIVVDSDGDDLPDGEDACPDTPGGELDLDLDGCPDAQADVLAFLEFTLVDELSALRDAAAKRADVAALDNAERMLVGPSGDSDAFTRVVEGRTDLAALRFEQARGQLDRVDAASSEIDALVDDAEYLASLTVVEVLRDEGATDGELAPIEECIAAVTGPGALDCFGAE